MTQDEKDRADFDKWWAGEDRHYLHGPSARDDAWAAYQAAIKLERNRNKWIPVSEGLPERGVEVLSWICTWDGDKYMTVNCLGSEDWDGHVLYWQELPSPPKGDQT